MKIRIVNQMAAATVIRVQIGNVTTIYVRPGDAIELLPEQAQSAIIERIALTDVPEHDTQRQAES